jgi:hypothetical protein
MENKITIILHDMDGIIWDSVDENELKKIIDEQDLEGLRRIYVA